MRDAVFSSREQYSQPVQTLAPAYSGSLSMQVPHWIVRSALVILICLFVEFFLDDIRYLWFSHSVELMQSVAQRYRTGIEPQT